MKNMNIATRAALVSGLVFGACGSVFAAIDPAVSGALDTAKTDVATIGGLVLVVILAAATFKYLRRAL